MEKKKKIDIRAITSLTVTLSFALIAFSGTILYISPKGRVANWTGWTMAGMGKESWGSVHTTLGMLFIAAGILHLIYNWKVFLVYVKKPFAAAAANKSVKEIVIAVCLVVIVFAGTAMEAPPFNSVHALGSNIKDYWEGQSVTGPYAHAEEDSLADFAKKLNRPEADLLERLEMKGYKTEDLSITVGDLAKQHGVNPSDIFSALSSGGAAFPVGRGGQGQGQGFGGGGGFGGPGGGAGGGFGRKSLEQVCSEYDVALSDAIAKLKEKGVEASGPENIRALANEAGMEPGELAEFIGAGKVH